MQLLADFTVSYNTTRVVIITYSSVDRVITQVNTPPHMKGVNLKVYDLVYRWTIFHDRRRVFTSACFSIKRYRPSLTRAEEHTLLEHC